MEGKEAATVADVSDALAHRLSISNDESKCKPLTLDKNDPKVLAEKRFHLVQLWSDLVTRQLAIWTMNNHLEELEKLPVQLRRLLIDRRQRIASSCTDFRITSVILRLYQMNTLEKQIKLVMQAIEESQEPMIQLRKDIDQATFAVGVIMAKAADLRAELVGLNAL